MRLLLDTHALLWWLLGNPALSEMAEREMRDTTNEIYVSAVAAWEIATKYRIGKLPAAAPVTTDLERKIMAESFFPLPVTLTHGETAGALPRHHRDPWDRMLIAQAMTEGLVLVSNERVFDAYGVKRLW